MTLAKFYDESEILITGGSGVVGKALIEKLLRSCNVKKVYILLRPKKNRTIEERLDKLQNAKIFRHLRATKPNELNKLVAIPGDAVQPKLGITTEYANILVNVSIIFHCAATVRFDEPLNVALKLNVGGTLEALKLAETLKNLKVFMHVSTYFSNPYLTYVESKVYDSPMDWKLCLKLLEDEANEDTLDFLTKKMIIGFPNTYTFTKNIAESLVNDYRANFPVCIYRPSIVIFSTREPEPGFPSTIFGAMGLFTLMSVGILKTLYMGKNVILDLTPQDFAVKSMLHYAVKTSTEYKIGKLQREVPVFLTSSVKHLNFTFKQILDLFENEDIWAEAASEKTLMVPGCHSTSCRFVYMFLVFTKQVIPALIADCFIKLCGHKPLVMNVVRKVFISIEVMKPFLSNTYDSPGITDEDYMLEKGNGTEFDIKEDLSFANDLEKTKDNHLKMVFQSRDVILQMNPNTIPKYRRINKIKAIIFNCLQYFWIFLFLRFVCYKIFGYFIM